MPEGLQYIKDLGVATEPAATDTLPCSNASTGVALPATPAQIVVAGLKAGAAFGTLTDSKQALITQTWNDAGDTFIASGVDITDTASKSDSLLVRHRVGGTNRFTIDKAGNTTLGGSLTLSGRVTSPAGAANTTITGTANNVAWDFSFFQRISGSSTPIVTGVAPASGGVHADGAFRFVYNVGATAIQFNHNSGSSTAANRIFFQGAANVSLAQNECLFLQYDATDNGSGGPGWRGRKMAN